jgi:hypothetical protein
LLCYQYQNSVGLKYCKPERENKLKQINDLHVLGSFGREKDISQTLQSKIFSLNSKPISLDHLESYCCLLPFVLFLIAIWVHEETWKVQDFRGYSGAREVKGYPFVLIER